MKLTWKLLPVVAAAAMGLMMLMPGIGTKDASADVHNVGVSDASVASGETITITIDADQNDGDVQISLGGVSATTTAVLKLTDCNDCSDEGDISSSFVIDSADLAANGNVTLTLQLTCTQDDNLAVIAEQDQGEDSEAITCTANTATATLTGTPPTSTPTTTATPTGDTITLSAVQPNTGCGQAVFLFATVKNNQGGFVAGANVTFTSSGGGTFSPVSALTVTDGVASSTFSPPTSGNATLTITATTGGKTATASVPVNCANATSTPAPAAPTATPSAGGSTVRPPSTGDAGLADGGSNFRLYTRLATIVGTVFLGAFLVARRRA
jgi:hypothetical protein